MTARFNNAFTFAEEKRNTPKGADADENVNNAADKRTLTAEDPCYDVKAEQAE